MGKDYSGPKDRLITEIDRIADALSGVDEVNNPTGDRLRDSLKRIADYFSESKPVASGAIEVEESKANTVAGVVADLNALIRALKNSGVIKADQFTMAFATVTDTVEGHADRQFNTGKISSVEEEDGVITITLSSKVSALKDFNGGGNWGTHKWLGIGVGVGVSPITNLKYNGTSLGAEDVEEATLCSLSAGYFVRWVAADLVLAGDNSQSTKDTFTLWADGYEEATYTIKIVEPSA